MLFLVAQIRRFGTLNTTQKTTALYKAQFLKKSRKTDRNWPLKKKKKNYFPDFLKKIDF